MNPERAQAYRRVIQTLAELGPAKLQPAEQERIRYAADSLILCADLFEDDAARDSLEDTELLCEVLVQSGRWERVTADQSDRRSARLRSRAAGRPLQAA